MMKRSLDLVVGAALTLLTAPLWIGIALAIRFTSPGPILYAGRRIGRDGKPFSIYKFRTMRADADRVGPGITAADDPRITRVGRLLRTSKLDELPQLINVLRGEMSLVGPRPEAPEYVQLYDDRQRAVLSMRPGITGPTQLAYRHEERMLLQLAQGGDVERQYREVLMPRKLESDLEYVRSSSILADVRYIAATVRRVLQ